MATHSSIPPWRVPWTEEPGKLQSMGSKRVRHDGKDLAQVRAVLWYFLIKHFVPVKNHLIQFLTHA